MSATQVTTVPPTPIGPGVKLNVIKDNFSAGNGTLTISLGLAEVFSVETKSIGGDGDALKVTNTLGPSGLITPPIVVTRTGTNSQDALISALGV